MKWNNPDFLLWLFALIPLFILMEVLIRRRQATLKQIATEPLWNTMAPGYSIARNRLKNILRLCAIALVIIAVARPQWGFKYEEVRQHGLSILVALDTSKSMLAQDIKPNRLQQAKWGIRDLIKELKGDRIGLVAFAGDAFLQCPITIDYAAFLMMLDDVYAGIIPFGGTDIYEALTESIDGFKEDALGDKVIILISDGEGHTGDPLSLLPQLKKENIRVFAIGVGTLSGELIQTSDGFVKDEDGNVIKSTLNETMLKRLAAETGGFYVRSVAGDFGLERIYKQGLSELQRQDHDTRRTKIWHERFPWFLGLALFFILLDSLIKTRTPIAKSAAKAVQGLLVIFLLALPSISQGEETPRSAMRKGLKAYKAGDYTNAVELIEKTTLEFPAIGRYNLGNALYRNGEFEKAHKEFSQALNTTDLKLQEKAYFNYGNALLARTTTLTSQDQIGLAIELAFQAEDMYEKAILLAPENIEAKQNFERARNLRLDLEFNHGKWFFDQAEALLTEFKAKEAKQHYLQAKKPFTQILEDIDPSHNKATQYLKNVDERLQMLADSITQTEKDWADAIQMIKDYQYPMAAQHLNMETDTHKYAFDQDPDLKKKYEETLKKNQDVLQIIIDLFSETNNLQK